VSRNRIRRYKIRPVFRNREQFGEMTLINEVYQKDEQLFRECFRMTTKQFDYLVSRVGTSIARSRHSWKDSINVRQRLAMTLR